MPAAVSPAIRPAYTTPRPPGTGTAPPPTPASELTVISVAMLARCPTACSDAPRAKTIRSWGQGQAAGQAIVLACLAARNRRQPGEDTSGDG